MLVMLTVGSGCSSHKNLTPATAKELAQAFLEEKRPNGNITTQFFLFQYVGQELRTDSVLAHNLEPGFIPYMEAGLLRKTAMGGSSFKYEFTPKFEAQSKPGPMVTIGQERIVGVESLLLDSETVASGRVKVHTEINDVGRVVAQAKSGDREGSVRFQKQPDGTWVCASLGWLP
jgi:hypothetical protein